MPLTSTTLPSDRRAFCRTAGRWFALAAIGGAAGAIVLRGGSMACTRAVGCTDCGEWNVCALPQAVAAREREDRP